MNCDNVDASLGYMHKNPHMQMKDSRLREGEDKRAISSDRNPNFMNTAHSPSARQPTTAEKYTLFGYSEDCNLCKTPQTEGMAFGKPTYIVSPYFFHRNTESRFHFARSMDPNGEAAVGIPENIYDILERNIRTMSNKANNSSIDNTSSTDLIDFREDWSYAFDRLGFDNEKMVEMASRRSSPRNKQPRHNLSPRTELNKKPGSLTRKEENYISASTSNHMFTRSSLHSKQECYNSNSMIVRYDSESTSNNEFHPDQPKTIVDTEFSAYQFRK